MERCGAQKTLASLGQQWLGLIGNTPLVSLPRLERECVGVRLFAKAEWFNPGGSVKDRAAASIIADAEARGLIREGVSLLDATSGNTGVAYAMIAVAKGYHATLCVPKNANPQVLGLLRAYGAELVLTDPLQGSDGAIREARRLIAEHPDRFIYLDQYNNPANWQAHYRTTAEEIWEQTRGTVTHFVAGLGTTGTFTGTTRRLKELNPRVRAIAVQPDETMLIATESAYDVARRMARTEGILLGPSSGAALAAGLQLARTLSTTKRTTDAVIVMIFPDSGARYVTEGLFDEPAQAHRGNSRDTLQNS